MKKSELGKALRNGQRVYGCLITSTSPHWPTKVLEVGLDFVFICTEHVPIGHETLSWMCQTYRALDLPPVVRIPSPDPYEACKVLDAGACGVIAPYVETAEQVRTLVGATKLKPLKGERLTAALEDINTLEPKLREYLEKCNADNVLIVNIESVPAINNLDEILAVPGLDGVLVGPHDLSTSLGIPEEWKHPCLDEAIKTIIRKARNKNVGAGIHFWRGIDQEIEWAKAGANLMMHSGDISAFVQVMHREIGEIREALGDKKAGEQDEGSIII